MTVYRTDNAGLIAISHWPPSILLIALGTLAVVLPFFAGLSLVMMVGIGFLLVGIAYSYLAFASRRARLLLVRLILAIVFAVAGMDLIFYPTLGLVTLTLILATVFCLEGFAEIFAYIRLRRQEGSGWLFANGCITMFLAALIWAQWPSSAAWAIGTLVGINLITSGIAPMFFFSE